MSDQQNDHADTNDRRAEKDSSDRRGQKDYAGTDDRRSDSDSSERRGEKDYEGKNDRRGQNDRDSDRDSDRGNDRNTSPRNPCHLRLLKAGETVCKTLVQKSVVHTLSLNTFFQIG